MRICKQCGNPEFPHNYKHRFVPSPNRAVVNGVRVANEAHTLAVDFITKQYGLIDKDIPVAESVLWDALHEYACDCGEVCANLTKKD